MVASRETTRIRLLPTRREKKMATVKNVTANELETNVFKTPGVVALDFYQATCPPCRALEPRLERIAHKYEGRVPVYRVDIDRDMPVAERFGVKSIPTILMVRGGKEVARLDGLITDGDLTEAFDREAG
jgi:thioredoxin